MGMLCSLWQAPIGVVGQCPKVLLELSHSEKNDLLFDKQWLVGNWAILDTDISPNSNCLKFFSFSLPFIIKFLERVVYIYTISTYFFFHSLLKLLQSDFHPHNSTKTTFVKLTSNFHVPNPMANFKSSLYLTYQQHLTKLDTPFLKQLLFLFTGTSLSLLVSLVPLITLAGSSHIP